MPGWLLCRAVRLPGLAALQSSYPHRPPLTRTASAPLFPSSHPPLQVQLGDKLALVREGRVVHVLATASSSLFPRVAALRPLAAAPSAEGHLELSLWGYNLGSEEDTVLARSNGARLLAGRPPPSKAAPRGSSDMPLGAALPTLTRSLTQLLPPSLSSPAGVYLEVERLRLEADPAWAGMQRLDLRVAGAWAPGALQLEVMRGGYISGSKVRVCSCCARCAVHAASGHATSSACCACPLSFIPHPPSPPALP